MTSPVRFTSTMEVVQTIRNGQSCAILVEGEEQGSDAWILRYILKDRINQAVIFHGRDGRSNLLRELPDFVNVLPAGKVAAIVDRDFTDTVIVEQTYLPDYLGHLFFWRRYCIENYLLEPAWIAEVIETFYMHKMESVPKTLRIAEAIEKFLLDWCKRLLPQVAGNWVIWELNPEVRKQNLVVETKPFDALTERTADWVINDLTKIYGALGESFNSSKINTLFSEKLKKVLGNTQSLSSAHQVISGKILLSALYSELPTPKPTKDQIRNRLMQLASKQIPEDMRLLVEDRILPRWREARRLAQQ